MSKSQSYQRIATIVALLSLSLGGCSHNASSSAQIDSAFSPFSTTRNQVLGLVYRSKQTLDASDINTLAVDYTALQEKANAYTDFMVEAVTTSSFDAARNTKYAGDFATAIATFDKAMTGLADTHRTTIATAWVPSFSQTLQTRWSKYSAAIAKMTPQQKADLIAELKRDTVWPNYEDIATEPVVGNPSTVKTISKNANSPP